MNDSYAFLVKPFTASELFAAIEVAMANYTARKANAIADTLAERMSEKMKRLKAYGSLGGIL